MAVRGLYRIILVTVLSIALLSFAGLILRGLVADEDSLAIGSADEALSILGNVASAAVGGLVGWLTRATLVDHEKSATPDRSPSEGGSDDTVDQADD
jgi:hypothetical protein